MNVWIPLQKMDSFLNCKNLCGDMGWGDRELLLIVGYLKKVKHRDAIDVAEINL
jgi:hypothetical protein